MALRVFQKLSVNDRADREAAGSSRPQEDCAVNVGSTPALFLIHVLSHHMRPRCLCRLGLHPCVYFQPISTVRSVRQTETDSPGVTLLVKRRFSDHADVPHVFGLLATNQVSFLSRPIVWQVFTFYCCCKQNWNYWCVQGALEIQNFKVSPFRSSSLTCKPQCQSVECCRCFLSVCWGTNRAESYFYDALIYSF